MLQAAPGVSLSDSVLPFVSLPNAATPAQWLSASPRFTSFLSLCQIEQRDVLSQLSLRDSLISDKSDDCLGDYTFTSCLMPGGCWERKSSDKSQLMILWFCWKTRDGDIWPGAEGKT